MDSPSSSTPSLTPSRSPTPQPPLQPDHFYGNNSCHLPLSPNSDSRAWLSPDDDPMAQRGIPVFKPTMEEFQDFEGYMNRVECWGNRSGIVKIIPPQEWKDSLPPVHPQLANVKLKNPIEQQMMGHAGLFRQQNIERRKFMSVREWSDLCAKDEMRAPGVGELDLHARSTTNTARAKARRGGKKRARVTETAEPEITPDVMVKEEQEDEEHEDANIVHVVDDDDDDGCKSLTSPPETVLATTSPGPVDDGKNDDDDSRRTESTNMILKSSETPAAEPSAVPVDDEQNEETKSATKGRRLGSSRQAREAALAKRAAKDEVFLQSFNPHTDWLPPNTKAEDYTPEFCKELERRFWRYCGLGKPAWYGADMAGSLFTDETKAWNVAHLPSALSRLLPASEKGLPGVNTPYLYFGMWRATFAWHVEDMDLFSINYIHFGAPKFWYAIPQGRSKTLETIMRGYFPNEVSNCSQFLRHKSFLASPTVLAQSSCRPNYLVQHAGEFVVTFPRGYHAGFNLGFNCAESVNFALNSWLDMGRVAKACECVDFSVRIDVDQLLRDREAERHEENKVEQAKRPRKRKSETTSDSAPKAKRLKTKVNKAEVVITTLPPPPRTPSKVQQASTSQILPPSPTKVQPKVTLKLGPKPKESDVFPCSLCVSTIRDGLLRVHDPPMWRLEADSGEGASANRVWRAHEECARVIPETWVDEVEVGEPLPNGTRAKEKVVMGVDAIVKGRWNLKCSACTKTRHKAHGAPIQCTKGKCPKAFHVSCARDGADHNIVYNIVREVEKEVLLIETQGSSVPQAVTPAPLEAMPDANSGYAMDVGATQPLAAQDVQPAAEPQVLKLIKKFEVEVLCSQHNPAVTEAKKAAKMDKIRNELIALPPMARIKLRVSAGVFEVSLVRVIEETKCVEVIWDRGMKKEFKWGSIVFGTAEIIVGQKPTEVAPPAPLLPQRTTSTAPSQVAGNLHTTPPPPGSAATYTPHSHYYHQPQPIASTSYHPQTAPYPPQAQHYRSAYQQPSTYAPYSQPQPASAYYNATRPWTSYHYPPYQTQTTASQPAAYTQPPNTVVSTVQRPGYTAMSYQPHPGYQYTSGASSYNQLAQQVPPTRSYHASPAPSADPSSHPSSRPPSTQPSYTTPPPMQPAGPPPVSRPASAAHSHSHTPPPPVSAVQSKASQPPPPPLRQASPQQPTPQVSALSQSSLPRVVGAQFHVTTPASYMAQGQLQWQMPYIAP